MIQKPIAAAAARMRMINRTVPGVRYIFDIIIHIAGLDGRYAGSNRTAWVRIGMTQKTITTVATNRTPIFHHMPLTPSA